MANFLNWLFPPDPAKLAFERKMRLNKAASDLSAEVRRQDRFFREYLSQAVEAKRTGDAATLSQIKKQMAYTVSCRKRAQKMLHAVKLFSTMSDQTEACRSFCGVLSDVSISFGNSISMEDVAKAQENLQHGMQSVQATEHLMDDLLSAFDSSLSQLETSAVDPAVEASPAIDSIIDGIVDRKDTATEESIQAMLDRA